MSSLSSFHALAAPHMTACESVSSHMHLAVCPCKPASQSCCLVRVVASAAGSENGAAISITSTLPSRYRSAMERAHAAAAAEEDQSSSIPLSKVASEKKPVVAVMEASRLVLSAGERVCEACGAAGAVACATCDASGLYIDPVLECQGIIKRVTCMGCGGSGSILCTCCWGRGKA